MPLPEQKDFAQYAGGYRLSRSLADPQDPVCNFLSPEDIHPEQEDNAGGALFAGLRSVLGADMSGSDFYSACMLYMIGLRKDHSEESLYDLQRVLDPEDLIEEKKQVGRELAQLLTPQPDENGERKIPSGNIGKFDTALLRGVKASQKYLENLVLEAVRKEDITPLYEEKAVTAAVIGHDALIHFQNYCTDEKQKIKPGSLLARISQPMKDSAYSPESAVFGRDIGFRDIAHYYKDMDTRIIDLNRITKSFSEDLAGIGEADPVKLGSVNAAVFHRMTERSRGKSADSLSVYQICSEEENPSVVKEIPADPAFSRQLQNDPLLKYGAMLMAYDNTLCAGQSNSKGQTVPGRKELLRRVYLSDMNIEPFRGQEEIRRKLNEISDYLTNDQKDSVEWREKIDAAYNSLDRPLRNRGDYEKLYRDIAAYSTELEKKVFEEKGKDIPAALQEVKTKTLKPVRNTIALLQAGARLPEREDAMGSGEAIRERMSWLNEMTETMHVLRGYKNSDEWKNLNAALTNAQNFCRMNNLSSIEKDPDLTEKLNSVMTVVKETAFRYIQHKVDTDGFDHGKDLQRLAMAKQIESYAVRELQQTSLAVQKNIRKEADHAGEMLSDSALRHTKSKVEHYRTMLDENRGSSREWDAMMSSLKELTDQQEFLLTKKDRFNAEDDRTYFSSRTYKGSIRQTLEKMDACLQNMLNTGKGKTEVIRGMETVFTLKNYLQTLQLKADQTAGNRYRGYEAKAAETAEKQKKIEEYHVNQFKEPFSRIRKMLIDLPREEQKPVAVKHLAKDGHISEKVKEIKKLQIPEVKKPEVIKAVCYMYQYQKYEDAAARISLGRPQAGDSDLIQSIRHGKAGDLVESALQKNKGLKWLVENRLDEVVSAMTSEKGRRTVIHSAADMSTRAAASEKLSAEKNKVQQAAGTGL